MTDPIRVMVVDDSAVVRGLITRMMEAESDISVVASVSNGQLAVNNLDRQEVEVVVLDIEMPVMDGLTALPKLLEKKPGIKIIMASTLTLRNAEISMRALEKGAADYIAKPTSSRDMTGGNDFRQELVGKVRSLGAVSRRERGYTPSANRPATTAAAKAPVAPRPQPSKDVVLREAGSEKPDIIAIGSSTGGPQALFTLLKALRGKVEQPIIITQHMPATFTTILAEHITRMSGWPCQEASQGIAIKPGQIYVAPGDWHMTVQTKGTEKVIQLNQDPPENFCRPAVDPMFRSVAKVYGRRALAVVLTGMGSDGMKGGRVLTEAGGTLIAQDEATSVVWGMPGAVATAGLCSAVLPLTDLASYITRFATRGAR